MAKNGRLRKGDRSGSATFNGSSWYHRYKELLPNGDIKYRRKEGFVTAEEANEDHKIREQIFETEARRQGLATKYDGRISFVEYLKYYLENVLSPKCAPSTKTVFSYSLYRNIIPNISYDAELQLVNEDYLNALLKKVEPISRSAGNKAREFIYLALKNAVAENRIRSVPAMKAYPRRKAAIKILTTDQVRALLDEAKETEWYLDIMLGLFMGLRKGEILGLKWSDIADDLKSLTVRRQLSYEVIKEDGGTQTKLSQIIEKAPKTENSIRTLYIPKAVGNELKRRKSRVETDKEQYGDKYTDNDYVCCQRDGKPRGSASINKIITTICKKRGLPHITVHALRHMYASILIEQGYELQVISAVLGHSSIHTTFEYYADIMDAKCEIKAFYDDIYAVDGGD